MIKTLSAQQEVVLIYEPPEAERVTVATNGIAWVHLDVKGLSAHACSAPEKDRNPPLKLSNQILQLKDLRNPAKGTSVSWTETQVGNKRSYQYYS